MAEKPSFAPRSHEVWPFEGDLGFRRSIESAGTVAAPLLAGFSFTLLVLLLPTLGHKQTTVRVGEDVRVISESQGFSAVPEFAAVSLLLAGLLFIASVQAAISMRYHGHTPGDLQEWFPEYFREGEGRDGEKPPEVPDLDGWHVDQAAPISVGRHWYGAWPREHLFNELLTANRWGRWARGLYHGGIGALLVGLALIVTPPGGEGTWERWVLFAVAVAGALAEFVWIAKVTDWGRLKSLVSGSDKPKNPEEPGSDDETDLGGRTSPPPAASTD